MKGSELVLLAAAGLLLAVVVRQRQRPPAEQSKATIRTVDPDTARSWTPGPDRPVTVAP